MEAATTKEAYVSGVRGALRLMTKKRVCGLTNETHCDEIVQVIKIDS